MDIKNNKFSESYFLKWFFQDNQVIIYILEIIFVLFNLIKLHEYVSQLGYLQIGLFVEKFEFTYQKYEGIKYANACKNK